MSAPKFISLWEMIEQGLIAEAVELGASLEWQAKTYRGLASVQFPPIGQRVEREGVVFERGTMAANVATTTRACKKWALQASMLQANDLDLWIRHGHQPATFLELAGRLDSLRQSILNEAVWRLYVQIPPDLSQYANQEKPCGDAVYDAFPSSRADLREAGNCIACGLNSAAVYHAMCALEPAMKALAQNVRVPWSPKNTTWGQALSGIDKRIKAIASGRKTRGLPNRVVFLSQAASEFRYFKDGWRNDTMHARYKAADALDAVRVLTHVKTFLALLSSRLHERGVHRP